MTFDVKAHFGTVERSVSALERDGKPARAVTLARDYDTTANDLWDALTNPERLPRWFLPVEGDLRPGGRYQLKGNAGGSIMACEPPTRLDLTWEFGDQLSWVEVRLTPEESEHTRLTLTHIAPVNEFWAEYGPGAVGVGWDLGLAGLAMHLLDPAVPLNGDQFSNSSEGRAFIIDSSRAWGEADIAAGADPAQARAAATRTGAFYTGSSPPTE